jgi:hypothetical protein
MNNTKFINLLILLHVYIISNYHLILIYSRNIVINCQPPCINTWIFEFFKPFI